MKEKNLISIHAPTRGATTFRFDVYKRLRISIHAPTRGATQAIAEVLDDMGISIHAPTRGATFALHPSDRYEIHFNPRSHEGSDRLLGCPTNPVGYFNPRSHEGSDLNRHFPCTFFAISIHAPTRGATFRDITIICTMVVFQSTLPRGERHYNLNTYIVSFKFQSTLPRGERPQPQMLWNPCA